MTSNRKRVLVPNTLGEGGWKVLNARDDLDLIRFSNPIATPDFHALLRDAPATDGVILGLTRFGGTECAQPKAAGRSRLNKPRRPQRSGRRSERESRKSSLHSTARHQS